jgi:hypothetical protein
MQNYRYRRKGYVVSQHLFEDGLDLRTEATGDIIIVRYADDVVVGFECMRDTQRF